MKRDGFSLIEIIIALAIGSVISIMAYQVFTHTVRLNNRVGTLVDDYADTFIMSAQFERDIMGIALIPLSDTKETGTQAAPAEEQASSVAAASSEESEQKREEKLSFFCTMREGKLDTLSFITTNGLPQVDAPISRLVRVRYFLQPQRGDASLSQLMREETPFYAKKQASSADRHAYPILSRIETISLTLYVVVQKDSAEHDTLNLTEWGTDAQRAKIPLAAPEFIALRGSYRSQNADESIPFSLLVAIPAARLAVYDYEKEQEKKAKNGANTQKQEAKR